MALCSKMSRQPWRLQISDAPTEASQGRYKRHGVEAGGLHGRNGAFLTASRELSRAEGLQLGQQAP